MEQLLAANNASSSESMQSSCRECNQTSNTVPITNRREPHLCHLVAALAAAHVDDAVRVGVLGQRLRDDGLAAAKGAREWRMCLHKNQGSKASLHLSSLLH